jgi:hypothetical protein
MRSQTKAVRSCAKPQPVAANPRASDKIERVIRKTRCYQCSAVMDYEPWPEAGCSLAEAEQRTADSISSRLLQDSGTWQPKIKAIEERVETTCLDHLKSGRLVAYGRRGNPDAEPQVISMAQWDALTKIEWQSSSAAGDQAQIEILDIRVYPPLLAPCHVDLLAGRTLAEAFQQFVLGDPEVAALGREAVRLSPKFEAVIVRGRCQVHGFEEWPLAFERTVMVSTVHPEVAKRSIFDVPWEPDPLEVVIAAEALKHRYCALISILRRGELEGLGLPATTGYSDVILRSIWSRKEFYLDASAGDVVQDNPESTGRYDRLIRRWIGVMLQRPNSANLRVHDLGTMFHGKPSAHDNLLPATTEPQIAAIRQPQATARVETKTTSRNACQEWLMGIMAESKDKRIYSKRELWAQAQLKWSGTLSQRQFLAARVEAIRLTGAFAWADGGAPEKP